MKGFDEKFYREYTGASLEPVKRTLLTLKKNGMLFEIVRWRRGVVTVIGDGFRLNNNYRSRYARLIESQEPDLEGIFDTRELRAA